MAAGEEADALIAEIKRYFADTLRQVYYRANKLKTALNKAGEVVGKLNNPDFSNAAGPLTKKLQEYIDEFNKAAAHDEKEEINDVIAIYQNKYNSELKAKVEKFLAPQQEPKDAEPDILDMVVEPKVSEPITPTPTDKPQNIFTPEIPPEIKPVPTPSPKQPPVTPSTPQVIPPKPKAPAQPKSKVDEILSSIEGKNYSSEQVDLLKRVFSTMLVVCSSSQKKSVIQLMEIAVNSLK